MDVASEYNIIIVGLRLRGHHGVMDQERINGNEFVFDLSMEYDFSEGALNDNIDSTLNYAEAIEIVKSVNSVPSKLLENVAFRLNRALRDRWPALKSIKIKIVKPVPPIGAEISEVGVAVTILG